MYGFLSKYGVDKTQPIARTEVTKYIHRYIKENNLQNSEHKREINPDKTLQTLLGAPQEDSVSGNGKCYNFLRLQSYMSRHFPKKVAA
jgi:chromatin remodeling complex protein RSC6